MRATTSFVCQECGYESPEWLGRCPECGVWSSLREVQSSKFKVQSSGATIPRASHTEIAPIILADVKSSENERLSTGFSEMDGVLGGGIVKGSVILLAGDPGVGKSTLLLQIALNLSNNKSVVLSHQKVAKDPIGLQKKQGEEILRFAPVKQASSLTSFSPLAQNDKSARVLYVSGEESAEQVKLRSSRIDKDSKANKNIFILSLTNTDFVAATIAKTKPSLVIVDSIQTMESESVGGLSGSVSQVRYAASQFIKMAKMLNIPIFIVGHVTKEGMVAGPMVLSHMVDTVLFLEGEKFTKLRILRSLKNRFGPVDEVGIFTMGEGGIKETNTPQQFLTKNIPPNLTGSIISVAMEGSRALLVEIQGLVVSSKIPIPRRVSSGIDYKRLELLLAVLQKHCNLPIGGMDVFVNIAGGLKLSDPAADLGICLAIFSSFKNVSLANTVAISEVGLLGELRPASLFDKRVKEAKHLGFKNIISHDTYKTLNEVIRKLES